jgi:hypothetical protein
MDMKMIHFSMPVYFVAILNTIALCICAVRFWVALEAFPF